MAEQSFAELGGRAIAKEVATIIRKCDIDGDNAMMLKDMDEVRGREADSYAHTHVLSQHAQTLLTRSCASQAHLAGTQNTVTLIVGLDLDL